MSSPLLHVLALALLVLSHHGLVLSLPPVEQMSSADVSSWLSSLSLEQYSSSFTSHRIDGSSLPSLSSSDLVDLGVDALGHRKKILKAIGQLKSSPPTSSSPSSSSSSPSPSPSSSPSSSLSSGSPSTTLSPSLVCDVSPTGEANCGSRVWLGVRSSSEDHSLANWYEEAYPHAYDTTRCTIERIPYDRMTPALFHSSYYLQKPFILTPTPSSSRTTLITRAAWSRPTILATLGRIPVNLGTPHSLTAFGDGVISSTLGAYIHDLRNASVERISGDHYLFDRKGFFKQAAVLLDSYQPHPLFHWDTDNAAYGHSDSMTFALGPTGSGINFHYHKVQSHTTHTLTHLSIARAATHAAPSDLTRLPPLYLCAVQDGWNEVLFGRKRWFLYPPSVGAPPGGYNQFEAALQWYSATYESLSEADKPVECMQYPGEVFYVPEDWYHATINIGETVAVVGQASMPAEGSMMYHVYAGLDYGDRKDRKRSLAHFGEALRVAPKHPQIYNYFGNHYKSHNELRTAVDFYRKAVASNPKYSMAWLSLGQTLAMLQEHEEAYDALLHSVDLNPHYHETLLELGNVAYFQNDLDTAAMWLAKAVDVGKEDKRTNAYINLCSMYIALERKEECVQLAERRLVQFPREWYVWTVYAQALSQLDRRGEAKGILRDVIQRNGGEFPPAEQVWAQIEQQEEEDLRKYGIAQTENEDPRYREVSLDERLRQLKEQQQGGTAPTPAAAAPKKKDKVKVKVSVESKRSQRSSSSPPSSSTTTPMRVNHPPVYVNVSGSTAAVVRELKMVTSYDLSVLFPSSITRIPLHPSLITIPPLLNDPHPPMFVGSTPKQKAEREAQCSQYLEQRVISAPFAVQTWNTWMKSTHGRLFGELTLHAITPRQQQLGGRAAGQGGGGVAGDSEEDVVYAAWDGMVFTPSHFFSYERWCVAGHHCILEELQSMQLLTLSSGIPGSPSPPLPSTKPSLTLPSLAVFTGAVFYAQAKRVANPRDFGLGIKVDHVSKNMHRFEQRMGEAVEVKDNARIYALPMGEHLEAVRAQVEGKCPRGRLERHHYPSLVVVDQYMSGVNYAHFVTEILPKLAVLALAPQSPLSTSYLLLQPQSFVAEALLTLGIRNQSVLYTHPCVLYSADVVYQFTPLPLDMPTKESIGIIRRALSLQPSRSSRIHLPDHSPIELTKAGTGKAARTKAQLLNSSEAILISLFRPHPLSRSISNFAEVSTALVKAFPSLPIVQFDPAEYTFNEAVTLFSRAAVVVGVVGAGFANLAFAPLQPPPLLLQLVPTVTHHRLPCGVTPWWHYGEVIGAASRFLTVEGMGFDQTGWEVPIRELREWLNRHKLVAVV